MFVLQMTPINLVRNNSLEMQQFGGECVDDSLSMDTQDIVDQPAFTSITEIAVCIKSQKYLILLMNKILIKWYICFQVMNEEEARFKSQEQFGHPYNEDEFLIFNVAVRYPETIVSYHVESLFIRASYTQLCENHWLGFIACIACDFGYKSANYQFVIFAFKNITSISPIFTQLDIRIS